MSIIEPSKIQETISQNTEDAAYINSIVNSVVESYTKDLDTVMANVQTNIVDVESPSTQALEKCFLELTNALYFVSGKVETVGIYDGISKLAAQDVYNNRYLTHQESNTSTPGAKKPTVAESTAVAENASLSETVVNTLYSRAYKTIKGKTDCAQIMVNTISKIISRRLAEASLSSCYQPNTASKILNE